LCFKFNDQSVPVKILEAVEFDLKIEIRPQRNLRDDGNTDALLLRNEHAILVDEAYFMDRRQQNRVRFSVAHELGHLYLHPNLQPAFNSIDDWVNFQLDIDKEAFEWFELQADEFAGRLLVPIAELTRVLRRDIPANILRFSKNQLASDEVIDVVAALTCAKFGVCQYTMAKRIRRERLWPLSPEDGTRSF